METVISIESFRQEIRNWLRENCPASMRTPMSDDEIPVPGRRATHKNPDTKVWMDRCAEKGYTAVSWPREYGGAGFTKEQVIVWQEEMRDLNARTPLVGMGINMLGPALLEYGSDAQKLQHLPKIARGETRWCQGYSEPGAGSDLAALRTSAVMDGDDFIVNGQKIWTSSADFADWMFCLVRTEPDAPKQEGISFILIDMDDPGVSVTPILLISGMSPFCQTFLDDVRVPQENLVLGRGEGWTVAKRLLQYERSSQGGIGRAQKVRNLEEYAVEYLGREDDGRVTDPQIRSALLTHRMNDQAFSLTRRRSQEESSAAVAPGAMSSMLKYYGTEQNKGRYELLLQIMGTHCLGWGDENSEDGETMIARNWLRSKANSIEGGTSEIQLNVIAKRILGLPD